MNESMNDEAVYRTAPATPGLLKIYNCTLFPKCVGVNPKAYILKIDFII